MIFLREIVSFTMIVGYFVSVQCQTVGLKMIKFCLHIYINVAAAGHMF